MIHILVVEDDPKQNNLVCSYLMRNNYEVKGCLDADSAYDAMVETPFDLIISDIMMPGIDGFEFAQAVRNLDKNIPILFVSARDDMNAKSKGFALGIDDYLTKPYELEELLMRVKAILRRAKIEESKEIKIGDLVISNEERTAFYKVEEINLTVREFNILFKLLSYPKKTFTRMQLMNEFWDSETSSSSRTVDVYMTKLREKFAHCDEFKIVTVHGLGYKVVLNEKQQSE